MYAVDNVRKFVEEHISISVHQGECIVMRAEALSHQGLISGGQIDEIMEDGELALEFHESVMNDAEHIKIGLSALARRCTMAER